jgi:hypothetical protein
MGKSHLLLTPATPLCTEKKVALLAKKIKHCQPTEKAVPAVNAELSFGEL